MKEVTIDGVVYVKKSDVKVNPKVSSKKFIVRTYSAGVFFGEVKSRRGQEVTMRNARRLWSWYGAASLSQLAMEGVKEPDKCKFPCEVTEVLLTQVIEVVPCTEVAIKSINGVAIWKR